METIYVNVISRQKGHWGMYNSVNGAAGYSQQAGYKVMMQPHVGDSLVCRARNRSLSNFLKSDADYFFTLDDDVAIPPDALVKLIKADKPMIGGFYRLKKDLAEGQPLVEGLAFRGKDSFQLNGPDPVEVTYISGGCVMYTREFCQEMVDHYPELKYQENETQEERWALYQPYIHNNEYLSEDWAICQRAIDKGYKLYMHPQVLCDHWGLHSYGFEEILNGNS